MAERDVINGYQNKHFILYLYKTRSADRVGPSGNYHMQLPLCGTTFIRYETEMNALA